MSGGGPTKRAYKRRRHTRKVKNQPTCPETGKVRYRDQRAAQDALIVANQGESLSGYTPQRSYPCGACDGFHVTSMERDYS